MSYKKNTLIESRYSKEFSNYICSVNKQAKLYLVYCDKKYEDFSTFRSFENDTIPKEEKYSEKVKVCFYFVNIFMQLK